MGFPLLWILYGGMSLIIGKCEESSLCLLLALTERLVTFVPYLMYTYSSLMKWPDLIEWKEVLVSLILTINSLFNAHSVFSVEHTAASMLRCSGLSLLCRKLWAKGDMWGTLSFLCCTHMLADFGLTSVNTHQLLNQLLEILTFLLPEMI